MSDDFEARLGALLNESVDAQLATRTVAPPFTPPADAGSDAPLVVVGADELAARRRRRFTFLAVAATVVAIVSAALAVTAFGPSAHKAPPAAPTPARLKSVQLGGATLALPADWVVRPISRYVKGGAPGNSPQWCLTPTSVRVRAKSIFDCPVVFTAFTPSQETMDPDTQTGEFGDTAQAFGCFPTGVARYREVADTRTFGGRSAQFRQWTVTCPKAPKASYVEQQYTVPTSRGYIVSAYHSTRASRAALRVMAAHSTLPPRTGALRLADRGYVRSVHRVATGTRVTIARTVQVAGGSKQNAGVRKVQGTATYLVPRSVQRATGAVRRGDLVYVATDGHTVTVLQAQVP